MNRTGDATAPYGRRAVDELRRWPALHVCEPGRETGTGLAHGSCEIVHLHRPDEAELYLTWPVVRRIAPILLDSGRVALQPGSPWIRVRLDTDHDVQLLTSLVSVAIKASDSTEARLPRLQDSRCPHALAQAG